ncbi:chemotaxis protein CheW [Marinibaculum pumilum]|uniref:Chemotaxis protein CheW n=1 Tax=Marinibaculum pumilum TaxID=1766165 RepID=A0ABV7L116_9PROT
MANGSDRAGFDWEAAHSRVDRLGSQLVERPDDSPILRRRAASLAAPIEDGAARPGLGAHLVYARGGVRYGIPGGQCSEAMRLKTLLELPGAPAFLSGVMLHRGEMVAVVDVGWFLGLGHTPHAPRFGVVAQVPGFHFALAADVVEGVRQLHRGDAEAAHRAAFVQCISEDLVSVLDLEMLKADAAFQVDQETVRPAAGKQGGGAG